MSKKPRSLVNLDSKTLIKLAQQSNVPSSSKRSRVVDDCDEDFKEDKKFNKETLPTNKDLYYWRKFQEKELQRLATASANLNFSTKGYAINIVDDDDEMQFAIKVELKNQEVPQLTTLDRYQFDIPPQDLPIKIHREEILAEIDRNMFIVLTANTGTGKSTQIPQYILEDAHRKKQDCNIVVTQPRIIAATSVAKRVAIERKCECGTLVGYQVGLEKKADTHANADTRILFCTTGVLLQKLVNEKSLSKFTHVIIDEVHERDINIDMLLIVIRRLVATTNPKVRVILMSATMNSAKIADYFKTFKPYNLNISNVEELCSPAPILNLDVSRPFPIKINYLDDLVKLGARKDLVDLLRPGISDDLYELAMTALAFIIKTLQNINANRSKPSFLVFLPGIREIERFQQELYKPHDSFNVANHRIIILHSMISSEEYSHAYEGDVENKIILATNMAESSVTLPGVTCVLDFCLTKYMEVDSSSGITRLKLDWASRQSLEQRAGRVGRMCNGQVVRLIFRDHYLTLQKETTPEIKRVSLEFAVLKTKQLDLGRPTAVLALAIDPPSRKEIHDAIISLKEVGALTRFDKYGGFTHRDGELTRVGLVMTKLPLDYRISKLIILGYAFRCLNECIIMGVGFSSKGIFIRRKMSVNDDLKNFHHKMEFANGSGSDLIAILNAFNKWQQTWKRDEKSDSFDWKGFTGEKKWCLAQSLNLKNLLEMRKEVKDVKKRLKQFGMEVDDYFPFNEEKKIVILKMCIAGAFYPNYFHFGGHPPTLDNFKVINNLNPCSTVFFKGLKDGRLGNIYEDQIVKFMESDDMLKESCSTVRVLCERNSEKVYVQFKSYDDQDATMKNVPGEVKFQVYKALKLRNLGQEMNLKVFEKEMEIEFTNDNELSSNVMGVLEWNNKKMRSTHKCIYPKKEEKSMEGIVTHIENCGKFFFQPFVARKNLDELNDAIRNQCIKIRTSKQICEGTLLLVKTVENAFKRAKVMELPDADDEVEMYRVLLIDFGQCIDVNRVDLFEMDDEEMQERDLMDFVFKIPPQCFECRLSSVIPSPVLCPSGWNLKTKLMFENFVKEKNVSVLVAIKSFVDRVASVKLYVQSSLQNQHSPSLNEKLINSGFAIPSDDSDYNLYNENLRLRNSLGITQFENYDDEFAEKNFIPPAEFNLTETVKLEGPFTILDEAVLEKLFGHGGKCLVDGSSVNSILIDPYPFNKPKKLLVAAGMHETGAITLNGTTIMPTIPGISVLSTLIFSPFSEIRRNSYKNRVSNILSGLGGVKNDKKFTVSHFPDHDVLVTSEIQITDEDLEKINNLRSCMSSILNTMGAKNEKIHQMREEACKLMIQILSQERQILPIIQTTNPCWNSEFRLHFDEESETKCPVEFLYQPHKFLEPQVPLNESSKQNLKREAEELQEMANSSNNSNIFKKCRLCNEEIHSVTDLQIHLLKKNHKDRLIHLRNNSM